MLEISIFFPLHLYNITNMFSTDVENPVDNLKNLAVQASNLLKNPVLLNIKIIIIPVKNLVFVKSSEK